MVLSAYLYSWAVLLSREAGRRLLYYWAEGETFWPLWELKNGMAWPERDCRTNSIYIFCLKNTRSCSSTPFQFGPCNFTSAWISHPLVNRGFVLTFVSLTPLQDFESSANLKCCGFLGYWKKFANKAQV